MVEELKGMPLHHSQTDQLVRPPCRPWVCIQLLNQSYNWQDSIWTRLGLPSTSSRQLPVDLKPGSRWCQELHLWTIGNNKPGTGTCSNSSANTSCFIQQRLNCSLKETSSCLVPSTLSSFMANAWLKGTMQQVDWTFQELAQVHTHYLHSGPPCTHEDTPQHQPAILEAVLL
jgi:hypothetical protein